MIIKVLKQTKPDVIDINKRRYSKVLYDEMCNSNPVKERLNTGLLYLCKKWDSKFKSFETIEPSSIIAKVTEIHDDHIIIDIDEKSPYLDDIRSGKMVAGMRYCGKLEYNKKDKCSDIKAINLICFDLIKNTNYTDVV